MLSLLNAMRSGGTAGYGPAELPTAIDSYMASFVGLFRQSSDEERRAILGIMTHTDAQVFIAFSERMASLAVRTRSAEDLLNGLVGLGIGMSAGDDMREVLMIMSLHVRTATKLGLSPSLVFRDASKVFGSATAAVFVGFTHRTLENQSIEAMSYVESSDESGFRYRRIW